MIRVYLLILIVNLQCRNGAAFLNQTEKRITMDLMNTLDIRHWIFVCDSDLNSPDINKFKVFVNWKLPITYQSTLQLCLYLFKGSFPDVNTLIVYKVPNLRIVIQVLNFLAQTKRQHFASKFYWLIFVDQIITEYEEQELLIPYNCLFLIVQPKDSESLQLIEIYKVKNKTFKSNYGIWSNERGLVTTKLSMYLRRRDLNGSVLIMEYFGAEGVCIGERQCAHHQILYDFTKLMNFRFQWLPHPPEDQTQYFAVGGDISDLAYPYDSTFYEKRVDYFAPLFKINVNWYIKKPSFREQTDYYLQPFDEELWFVILICLIIGTSVCIFMHCLWKASMKPAFKKYQLRLIDCSFSAFENFCNQDGCPKKRILAFRVACIFFRIFALFMIPAYSGTIISYIAARKPIIPFQTLRQFVKNGKYKIGGRRGAYADVFFKTCQDYLIKLIYKNYYSTVGKPEVPKKLCKELFAYADLDNDIYGLKFKCSTYRIKDPIGFTLTAMFLSKNSPFTRVFRQNFIRYYSSGVQEKMQKIITGDRDTQIERKSYRRATILQMFQVFSIVPVGVFLAITILLLEILIKCISNRIRSHFCYHERKSLRGIKLTKIKLIS